MALTIIFAILIFSLIILVHELGHFWTARLFKVTVHEFAIGMGPKIFSRTKDNIKYSLRLIPVGGYCAMEGEDEESSDPGAFNKKPWWQRIIILAAGATMNVILGFLICLILLSITAGISKGIAVPEVNSVVEGSEAAEFLEEGDKIVKVGDTRINIIRDINFAMQQNGNKPVTITVKRDGTLISKEIKPYQAAYKDGTKAYIIGFTTSVKSVNPIRVIREAFYETIWMAKTVIISIGMLIGGQIGMNEMSGPVGVVSAMNESAQAGGGGLIGLLNLLFLGSFISVNIGIMNLLPLPALDGGRIFFTLIEAIRRKPIPPEKEGVVHFIGLILLFALMIFATWNDILRLLR